MSGKPRLKRVLKESKVQLRMRPAQKDLIARAAEIKQTTLTNFMVEHADRARKRSLRSRRIFCFRRSAGMRFAAALDVPPRLIPGLANS